MTAFVLMTCIVAATGGPISGYDIGISGGVTSMDAFLIKFFPEVYKKEKADHGTNQYCKFDSSSVTLFTSSLDAFLIKFFPEVASFCASAVTRTFGRKWSMFSGGITFLSVPVYLSEMAPANHRGMLNIGFQLMITLSILAANLINYGTTKIKGGWGWCVSLALAGVPALIITLGSLILPDTPNSLIERGFEDKAHSMLQKIRGIDDVHEEFDELVAASVESKLVKHPWRNIVQRKYRAQLTMAIMIPFFQQLTGINVIMFYAPVLFKTIGFGSDDSLMSAVITGLVNVFATLVSVFCVDRFGRRKLFLQGGAQMLACQIVVGTLIAIKFGTSGEATVSRTYAGLLVLFICVYVAGFAWSWGPLGWLVPSKIFPLEIRSAGQSINVSVNMFFTFVIAQLFLAMLCKMKFALFYFFGGWGW